MGKVDADPNGFIVGLLGSAGDRLSGLSVCFDLCR